MTEIYVPGACSIAIKCKDGVVLGNDNRVIWGYTVTNKSTKKVFALTDNIGITCSGLIGDFQYIVKLMQAQANLYELRENTELSVRAMSKLIANLLYSKKLTPLYVNIAVGGIDNEGSAVYTMDAIGSLMPDDYGVSGSAATMAVSILEAEYKPTITVKEGIKLAEKVIKASIKRDAMSGNGIDILAITKDGPQEISIAIDEMGE
ncbi:MAG: proteasome subunit beta [Promethearchaeota archaeon]